MFYKPKITHCSNLGLNCKDPILSVYKQDDIVSVSEFRSDDSCRSC